MSFDKEKTAALYDSIGGSIDNYSALAMRTAKDMGSIKMNFIHATFGISGEVDELSEPFQSTYNLIRDIDNIKEEIGDIYWFIALMVDTFNKYVVTADTGAGRYLPITISQLVEQGAHYTGSTGLSSIDKVIQLNKIAGVITDTIKKHTIYGKELDVTGLVNGLVNLIAILSSLMNGLNLTLTGILAGNIIKLAVRYPDKYSDDLASTRLDKA